MSMSRPLLVAALGVVMVADCARRPPPLSATPTEVASGPPAGWEGLPVGPRPVGFRQQLLTDETRRYGWQSRPERETRRSPRPVLLNVWYPAARSTGAPMTIADYLVVPQNRAVEPTFAGRLSAHVRRVLLEETIGTRAPQAAVEALLGRTTLARRAAPSAPGAFPLVLYHPGLGGGYEDNLVLAELLASHGYLVVSSAYQPDQRLDLRIDWDIERSLADLSFLLGVLRRDPSVDWSRLAVMGHSYGAQAALAFAMRNGVIDAVVSLDSTIEYMPAKMTEEASFAHHFGDGERLRAASLLFSTETVRNRAFLESLVWSDRVHLTIAGMDHNDFIAHGGALTRGVLPGYATVCRAVLAFLDARLRGTTPATDPLAALAGPGVKVERIPAQHGFASTDEVVRAVLHDGEASVDEVCRATACRPWMLADAFEPLIQEGRVPLAQRLLQRVANLLPPFRAKEESARIEKALGNAAAARTHLLEARRLLGKDKEMPPQLVKHFQGRIDRDLADLDQTPSPPGP
jgi:pimeloyl-ACP methyl ester carboxylesterase